MKNKLFALLKISKIQIHIELVYRLNYFVGLLKYFLVIAASYFLWHSLYSNGTVGNVNYDFNSMLIYSIAGVGLGMTIKSRLCFYMGGLVRSGNIAIELLKPISFQARLLFRMLGDVAHNIIFQFAIVSTLAIIIFGVDIRVIKIHNVILFIPLMMCGTLITFFMDYIVGLMCFWLTEMWGVDFAKRKLVDILSGSLFPLWVYPVSIRKVMEFTPFPYIFGYPLDVLISGASAQSYIQILLIEILWIVVLFRDYCITQ